jgi:hypothetical protein
MTVARFAWSQLRFRVTRTLALLTGLFVAATAFTVLTAASRTEQLRTVGTITASFSPSYDILVRPKRATTALEDQTGMVQPNFLSGMALAAAGFGQSPRPVNLGGLFQRVSIITGFAWLTALSARALQRAPARSSAKPPAA